MSLWLVLAALLTAPAAAQTTDEDLHKSVETLLAGFEKPAGDDDWAALGVAAVPHLLAIAQDEVQPRSTRSRAITALGNFDTPEVRAYLVTVLESGDSTLQRKALRPLARTAGAEELARIGGFLDSDNSTLREAAAQALGVIGTEEAKSLLSARLEVETSEAVTKTIEEELAR